MNRKAFKNLIVKLKDYLKIILNMLVDFVKNADRRHSIKFKIYFLICFIFAGLIVFIITIYLINENQKKSLNTIYNTNSIIQNLNDLMDAEDSYLNSRDKKHLSSFVEIRTKLNKSFKDLLGVKEKDSEIKIRKLLKLKDKHNLIFASIILSMENIENYRKRLESEIQTISLEVKKYVDKINLEEANLNMSGLSLSPVKRTLREENNKLLLHLFERYTFHKDLTMVKNFDTLNIKKNENTFQLNMTIKNIEVLAKKHYGIYNYSGILNLIKSSKKNTFNFEKELLEEFRKGKKILAELKDNSDKLKTISSDIYKAESLKIEDRNKVIGYTIISIISLSIITVSLVSLVLLKSIMDPVFETINVIKDISVGNLKKNLDIKRKGEIEELSIAVNRMIRDLRSKAQFAYEISRGNLKEDLKTGGVEDSLGFALLEMAESLVSFITSINNASENVLDNSEKITEMSRHLKEGSETQLKSLKKISDFVEEIEVNAKNNYGDAKDVNQLAKETKDKSESGFDYVREMHSSVNEMKKASGNIFKINKVIDDIAFQTQLLSINASIEAARAGKHGHGFSVVASEIRALAEKSSEAASETYNIIKGTLEIISKGKKKSEEAKETFKKIVDGINSVSELINSIVESSFEQQKGISEINEGIKLIEKVSVDNVKNSQDADSSAEDLFKQVDELKEILAGFKI